MTRQGFIKLILLWWLAGISCVVVSLATNRYLLRNKSFWDLAIQMLIPLKALGRFVDVVVVVDSRAAAEGQRSAALVESVKDKKGEILGWLSFLICAVPVYLLYNAGHRVLWLLALVNAIASLWSYGIMHNYAVESSAEKIKGLRRNLALEGKLDAEKETQIDKLKLTKNLAAVPNWLSTVNMVTFIIGLVFVIYGAWLLF